MNTMQYYKYENSWQKEARNKNCSAIDPDQSDHLFLFDNRSQQDFHQGLMPGNHSYGTYNLLTRKCCPGKKQKGKQKGRG